MINLQARSVRDPTVRATAHLTFAGREAHAPEAVPTQSGTR